MRRRFRWLAGISGVALVALIGPCRYTYLSVCTLCGGVRFSNAREIPVVETRYWTTHRCEETALSRVCVSTHLIGDHEHQWMLVHGNTFPLFSCSLGKGSRLLLQIQSPHVAAFVENVATYGSAPEATHWLEVALNPETSSHVDIALAAGQFPPGGFSDASQYRAWTAEGLAKMGARLEELIEPDNGR
jgi:hypothetical protein